MRAYRLRGLLHAVPPVFSMAFTAYAASVSTTFNVFGLVGENDMATSTVPLTLGVCSGSNFPKCTFTDSVVNDAGVGLNFSFNWTGPNLAFKGRAPGGLTTSNTFTSYLDAVEDTGTIVAGGVSPPTAPYFRPGSLILETLKEFGPLLNLSSSLSVGPGGPVVEFQSQATQVGTDEFEYVSTATNLEPYPVTFNWTAANFSGSLAPGQTLSSIPVFGGDPIEIIGSANFTLADGDSTITADALAPVPEPMTLSTVAIGLFAVALGSKLLRRVRVSTER